MSAERILVHREEFGGHLPDCDRCMHPFNEGEVAYLETTGRTVVILCEDHADEIESP